MKSCVASLDTCRVTYQIDSLKFGTEYGLFIHIDMNSSSYNNIKEGKAIITACTRDGIPYTEFFTSLQISQILETCRKLIDNFHIL